MPLYDFIRLSDGEPVDAYMEMSEVCGLEEVMDVDGEPCRRVLPRVGSFQTSVQRDPCFKAWSLPTAGCKDEVTGFTMPKKGEEGAPHYDKDGVAVFASRGEIREFCDSAERTTGGRGRYTYGE
jgi:hypothetical protein